MFFTEEDYKKIEKYLASCGVKDSCLEDAKLPIEGNEKIAIVQNGENRILYIRELIEALSNSKASLSDLYNVTDHAKEKYINLKQAIELVPYKARKIGQIITFLNPASKWELYQFQGTSILQWNELSLWNDFFNLDSYVIKSILPDEEDLTKSENDGKGNSYLSLKDREYNPDEFSGLGKVILRKNIMEVETEEYGKVKKNVLLQDMINKPNTIYEIRYDFDLNNQEITIPEGCTLNFQGGRFSNGRIVGNSTVLCGNYFIDSIEFDGSFICDKISESDFKYNNDNDLFQAISVLASSNHVTDVFFSNRIYNVSVKNINGYVFSVPSYTNIYFAGTIQLLPNDLTHFHVIGIKNVKNVNLVGPAKIIGDAPNHIYGNGVDGNPSTHEWGHNIKISGSENITIENITSIDATGDSLGIDSSNFGELSKNIIVRGCSFETSRRQGISIEGVDGVTIYGCNIQKIGKGEGGKTNPGAGIDIEPWRTKEVGGETVNEYCKNVIIEKCNIQNCYGGALSSARYVDNIVVKNSNLDVINQFHNNASGYINYYNSIIGIIKVTFGKTNLMSCKIGRLQYNSGVVSNVNSSIIDYTLCPIHEMVYEYNSVIVLADKISGTPYNVNISNCTIESGTHGLCATNSKTINTESITKISNCYIKVDGDVVTGTFDMVGNTIECHRLSIKNALGKTYKVIGNTIFINHECNSSDKSAIMFRKPLQDFEGYLVDFSYNNIINTIKDDYIHVAFPYEDERLDFSTYKLKWLENKFFNAFYSISESNGYNIRNQVELGNWAEVYYSYPEKNKFTSIGYTDPVGIEAGSQFYNIKEKVFKIWDGTKWADAIGNNSLAVHKGTSSERPTGVKEGYAYYDTDLGKIIYWATTHWKEEDGVLAGTLRSGIFYYRPNIANNLIYVGFAYFCVDRQTTEGTTNGIMIYHKGDDIWVDALGRVVS